MALHYLTVQDILWINLQLTGKVQHYSYARLEEATFYQYAYGASNSLMPQAARFVGGFSRMHPFEAGNEATGFVATAAFLEINGRNLNLTDDEATTWYCAAQDREATALSVENATTAGDEHHHVLQADIRGTIGAIIKRYPKTIADLTRVPA